MLVSRVPKVAPSAARQSPGAGQKIAKSAGGRAEDLEADVVSNAPASNWSFANIPLFPREERNPKSRFPLWAPSSMEKIPQKLRPNSLDAQLKVGPPDDKMEREADRLAASMSRAPSSSVSVAQPASRTDSIFDAPLSATQPAMRPATQECQAPAPRIVNEALRSAGQPLDPETRAKMEPRFGRDFGGVRVHTDALSVQSARALNARAYTVGNSIVFAEAEFAPRSVSGQSLLAHELTHTVQQGGQPQLIQRAPANYGSTATVGPQPDPSKKKPGSQLTADDLIWVFASLRHSDPEAFVKVLSKNEGVLYPVLSLYGFEGSKVKEQDSLKDFDAAVKKWGRMSEYERKYGRLIQNKPHPKPKSREERKYENAKELERDFINHGYERFEINKRIESAGLMGDLVGLKISVRDNFGKYETRTFEKEETHIFASVPGAFYQPWALEALRAYMQKYEEAHNIQVPIQSGAINDGSQMAKDQAQSQILPSMEESYLGAGLALFVSRYTDDPRIILAASELGGGIEASAGAVGNVIGSRGSYKPEVENKPAEAYTNNRDRISPSVDPEKVGSAPASGPAETPDAHPDAVKRPAPVRFEKLSLKERNELAKTNPQAAEAMRLRYRELSDAELGKLARNGDVMAESVRNQRIPPNNLVKNLPKSGEDRFSDPSVYDKLVQAIKSYRLTSGYRRSGPHAVTPDADTQGGVVGSAMTNVPGLEGRVFVAESPLAGGQVNPDSEFKPHTDFDKLPHTHGHAEQGLADQIGAAFNGIPAENLKGRTVYILIEQIPCSTCAAGTGTADKNVQPGVLAKLGEKFKTVRFEVKHMDASGNKMTLDAGKNTIVPLRQPAKPKAPDRTQKP
jgi:hypothetical protein